MILKYNREKSVEYALKWALKRNPKYFDFSSLGGDCTNFVSQCLFNGSYIMNFNELNNWYYISLSNRSPSWTASDFLYDFILNNNGNGIFGNLKELKELEIGDIILLKNLANIYYHSLIITNINNGKIYVSCHSEDKKNVPLSLYNYESAAFIKIEGINLIN